MYWDLVFSGQLDEEEEENSKSLVEENKRLKQALAALLKE